MRKDVGSVLQSALFAMLAGPVSAGPAFTMVQDEADRFWFQSPQGERFVSLGVCAIDSGGWRAPENSVYYGGPDGEPFHGDFPAWQESTLAILRETGFNTLGAWANPALNDGSMYAMPVLYIITAEPGRLAEIFRPGLENLMRQRVREVLAEHAHPERIAGFFLDNEASWWGPSPWTVRANSTLLEAMFDLAKNDPARRAATDFLAQRHGGDPAAFAQAWGIPETPFAELAKQLLETSVTQRAIADREAFTELAAERFYSMADRVLEEEAPGKLNLGSRFAGSAPPAVVRACGRYCDVVSVNLYSTRPSADPRFLAEYWLEAGKPVMITEFSWRGKINRSGNPNTRGAGGVVRTQEERGANYARFVEDYLAYPHVVGMHWFAWADQSPQGRFDGENSNYGIVDIFHRPYEELTSAMAAVNDRAEQIHGASERPLPTELPPPLPVVVEPGQFPDRPASIDLVREAPIQGHETFAAQDAEFQLSRALDGTLVLRAGTGKDWGGGVSLFGPKTRALGNGPAFATDLDGYLSLVLELESEGPLHLEAVLDEASVGPPGSVSFDTGAGDDGESFAWPPFQIMGRRQTVRLPLADLQPRSMWGNQGGKRRVDLAALKGPGIIVPGGQGAITVLIHSVRLEK